MIFTKDLFVYSVGWNIFILFNTDLSRYRHACKIMPLKRHSLGLTKYELIALSIKKFKIRKYQNSILIVEIAVCTFSLNEVRCSKARCIQTVM